MRQRYPQIFMFNSRRIGLGIFALFILFVAFKILTPPNIEIARAISPDNSKTVRLRKFYYVAQPSYKVDYREKNKLVWLNLLYLPSYTNAPYATAVETIEWSNLNTINFLINSTSIWTHTFEK